MPIIRAGVHLPVSLASLRSQGLVVAQRPAPTAAGAVSIPLR